MTVVTTDVVLVTIQGITGEIEAKIDTGAQQTSMHADQIKVDGENVVFQLNNRMYRAPLETQQDVSSSDGGTQERPVIRMTIEIEGKSIDTLVNLNDRSEMPQKVLIGQDVIRSAELTLQFTNDESSAESEEGGEDNQPAPDIYHDVSEPIDQNTDGPVSTPTASSAELVKQVLKLSADLNAMQKDLMALIHIINGTVADE